MNKVSNVSDVTPSEACEHDETTHQWLIVEESYHNVFNKNFGRFEDHQAPATGAHLQTPISTGGHLKHLQTIKL